MRSGSRPTPWTASKPTTLSSGSASRAYFQEYGPAGYHVSIGFANPAIINARMAGVCNGTDLNVTAGGACNNSVTGKITGERLSRTPDQRLYSSGSRDAYSWTQCYVSIGDPDGEDFSFTKCAADGTFKLTGYPPANWRMTVFDQWNDQIVDGLSTPVQLAGGNLVNMGDVAQQQWQSNINTRTFIDDNKDGVYQSTELGIPFSSVSVRYRDGELANNLLTDFGGVANFNETFPLFNWYTVETDPTRYKTTGIHTVYDAGGPADSTTCGAPYPNCGSSVIGKNLANTYEPFPLPSNLSVPGAVYCSTADCTGQFDRDRAGSQLDEQSFDGPHRSALGLLRGLAGLHRPVQFHRIREGALRPRRERRHHRTCRLCLHPSL